MNIKGSSHLTKEDRKLIERFLNDGLSCKEIADRINKDPRSISREVKKRRDRRPNGRYRARMERGDNKQPPCKVLERFPFVCNACHGNPIRGCAQEYRYYYDADIADENYRIILSDSRTGLDVTLEEKIKFDTILEAGIKKGQSIHHICQCNKEELPYSERTAYRLVDKNQTTVQAIDLRRKVKLKPRKHYVYKEDNREIRNGRTYADFLRHISNNPVFNICEIDTVEPCKESKKCLLTIHSTATHFMLIYLLDDKSKEQVSKKILELQQTFGAEDFKKVFGTTLTDRGTEFCDVNTIEVYQSTGESVANLFFCNSYSSYQKGAIEENHEIIRYILPKGSSFDGLTQEKVDLIASHINSYMRKSIGGSPYDIAIAYFGEELIKKTKVRRIDPNLVKLNSSLLK